MPTQASAILNEIATPHIQTITLPINHFLTSKHSNTCILFNNYTIS